MHAWMWFIAPVAHVAATVRVALSPARKKHVFLLALLVSLWVFAIAGSLTYGRIGNQAYFRLWLAAYLTNFSLVALALTEACTYSMDSYDRFAQVGRRVIQTILVSSGIGMILLLFFLPDRLARSYVTYFQAQAYLGQGSLALLGLSLLVFAKWARLQLDHNARLVMLVLTGLCALECLLGSTISAAWPARMYVGIVGTIALWGALILGWSRNPQSVRNPAVPPETDVALALAQMRAMNRQLGDIVRRG